MNNKMNCLEHNAELYHQLEKLVDRGDYLDVSVIMAQNCIEVIFCDEDGKISRPTGISVDGKEVMPGHFPYLPESWQEISTFLDAIAAKQKEKWVAEFASLYESIADGEMWGLDLTKPDYAILEIGESHCLKCYKIAWGRDGLLQVMGYLAKSCMIDSEE